MFDWLWKKKGVEKLESEVKQSFSSVKQDLSKVSQWIKHLDGKTQTHAGDLEQIRSDLDFIRNDIQGIKDMLEWFAPKLSKQPQTAVGKQTAVEAVQTPVQTAVQTGIFSNLTVMERAIVWALLNSEMKLSYEDLAAVLGKDKSTIRGQINGIRQKSEGIIEEQIEPNGKKRLYVPDKMRGFLLKSVKVRVKSSKRAKKQEKNELENT